MDASFIAFPRFNQEAWARHARVRGRLHPGLLSYFEGDRMQDRIARALAEARVLPAKELFESFEFYERVRRRVRAPVIADLCCGHGLTGILFAAGERAVDRVLLVDHERPASFGSILDAVASVAPWARDKVSFAEQPLRDAAPLLDGGASIVAVHACGTRTDRCLDLAIAARAPVAVMPCCYAQTARRAPRAVRRALGGEMATDVHRTYRLEQAGFDVDWAFIPRAITPMNRILLALPGPSDDSAATGSRRAWSP